MAVVYASWSQMAALDQHEAALRAADRRDGGNRYGTFRARQDRQFRAALRRGSRRR
jgi:hypothetical protein